MGKVGPQSVKYIIKAKFTTDGVVEKPDIIGAIFGQTEGLLGEELELRELQKKGKIGRISVSLRVNESKTEGEIEIPTSIDKAETTIIAAAIETIDRVGPCDAKFEAKSIEDVRSSKRDYILERAKKLLEKFNAGEPKFKEFEQEIVAHAKTAKIREYGSELLAAGPTIETANEMIVVEGRADVLNMLRCNIKNVIAMNGTVVPRTIKQLSHEKETILFIDGDRGGLLIAKDAIKNVRIAFISRAPDGKEVEELTEKEIITCLRNKLNVEEFKEKFLKKARKRREEIETEEKQFPDKLTEDEKIKFQDYLQEIEGTKTALLVAVENNSLKIVKKIAISEVIRALYITKTRMPIYALIIDGLVTPAIARAAEQTNCMYIVARNFAATSDKVKLLSF